MSRDFHTELDILEDDQNVEDPEAQFSEQGGYDDHHDEVDEEYNDEEFVNDYESDSSEDNDMRQQALPVSGAPEFSEGPPTSAEEYLRRVRWEAKQSPKVVRADIDPRLYEDKRTIYIPKETCPAPPATQADASWTADFISDFSSLRERLVRDPTWLSLKAPQHPPLPNLRDQVAWKTLILGHSAKRADVEHGHSAKRADVEHGSAESCSKNLAAEPTLVAEPVPEDHAPGRAPLLSLLAALDERSIARLLQLQPEWLSSARKLTAHHSLWLFALLAVVGTPVDADTSSSLREIVRFCSGRCQKLDAEDPEMMHLHMVSAIAGRHFGQGHGIVV
ncbi:hypothetical protein CYMTET_10164 [Cymbomonas tetramitiformis]|uniref:Gem-associated protein 2 n=1 Tax=Cymbomonas tetramitiformis TaxID=36881 RepID=A0AAE0GR90_9CHLO|nr:hypothetical protein CYMTET_10164 [Cymbomonas tetramitiformis]